MTNSQIIITDKNNIAFLESCASVMESMGEEYFHIPIRFKKLPDGTLEEVRGEELSKVLYFEERRTGNTTRIIDDMVQQLFKNGTTKIYDHYTGSEEGRVRMVNRNLNILLSRLDSEHQLSLKDKLHYNHAKETLTITK